MKGISVIFISLLLFSGCSTGDSNKDFLTEPTFEKEYYEKVTNIKFPKNYKVIASADNGEFVTITIIDLSETDCKKFSTDNKFEPIEDKFPQDLIGVGYLDSVYRQIPDNNKLLRNWGNNKKTNWIYLLDTTTCRLYCQIDYPDWAGT